MSIRRCTRQHFDKHVVKMILEYAQLLSTAWHMLNPDLAAKHYEDELLYKKTHYNHCSDIWTREHINNYTYVSRLALELCKEWRRRYGHPDTKLHKSEPRLIWLFKNPPPAIQKYVITSTRSNPKMLSLPLPQAKSEECKTTKKTVHATIRAYHQYYKSPHKSHITSWTIVNPDDSKDAPKCMPLDKPLWF
jgi:hypothetical protein